MGPGVHGPTQKRLLLAEQVAQLRAQGLTHRAIGERLGLSRSYANELDKDPAGEAARKRKDGYRRPCPLCGAPMNGSDPGRKRSRVCWRCAPDANRTWTRANVIASIQHFAQLVGRPPTATDWNPGLARNLGLDERAERFEAHDEWPATQTVQAVFGSWANGIESAGFPRPKVGARPSDPGHTDLLRAVFADGKEHTLTDLRARLDFDFSPSLLGHLREKGEVERVAVATYRAVQAGPKENPR